MMKLSAYERAVNMLNKLTPAQDKVFSAALDELRSQRDAARLEIAESERKSEAHREQAERAKLNCHVLGAMLDDERREKVALASQVEKLRNALAAISLDEYESTSSASEKVHGHARIARKVLYGET